MRGGLGDGDRTAVSEESRLGCRPTGVLTLILTAEVLLSVLDATSFTGAKKRVRVHYTSQFPSTLSRFSPCIDRKPFLAPWWNSPVTHLYR